MIMTSVASSKKLHSPRKALYPSHLHFHLPYDRWHSFAYIPVHHTMYLPIEKEDQHFDSLPIHKDLVHHLCPQALSVVSGSLVQKYRTTCIAAIFDRFDYFHKPIVRETACKPPLNNNNTRKGEKRQKKKQNIFRYVKLLTSQQFSLS